MLVRSSHRKEIPTSKPKEQTVPPAPSRGAKKLITQVIPDKENSQNRKSLAPRKNESQPKPKPTTTTTTTTALKKVTPTVAVISEFQTPSKLRQVPRKSINETPKQWPQEKKKLTTTKETSERGRGLGLKRQKKSDEKNTSEVANRGFQPMSLSYCQDRALVNWLNFIFRNSFSRFGGSSISVVPSSLPRGGASHLKGDQSAPDVMSFSQQRHITTEMYRKHTESFLLHLQNAIEGKRIRLKEGVEICHDFVNRHKIMSLLTKTFTPVCLHLALEVVFEKTISLPTFHGVEDETTACSAIFHTGQDPCTCSLPDTSFSYSAPQTPTRGDSSFSMTSSCLATPANSFVVKSVQSKLVTPLSSRVSSIPASQQQQQKNTLSDEEYITILSKFLLGHLFSNRRIKAAMTKKGLMDLYQADRSEVVIEKFFLIAWVVDHLKDFGVFPKEFCLFAKSSSIKSAGKLITEFTKLFISDGNILKTLSSFGFKMSDHRQSPIDELDLKIADIGSDFRDGVKLARLMEACIPQCNVAWSLRIPAVSRLQKIHNVQHCFRVLKESGLDFSVLGIASERVSVKDIVDGHLLKTLSMIHQILDRFHLPSVLNVSLLEKEVSRLEKRQGLASSLGEDQAENGGLMFFSTGTRVVRKRKGKAQWAQVRDLVFRWASFVCKKYGLPLGNMTSSFADGSAFLYLIHDYMPEVVPLKAIQTKTSTFLQQHCTTPQSVKEFISNSNSVAPQEQQQSPPPSSTATILSFSPTNTLQVANQKASKREKENYRALFQALKQLGDVPMMVNYADMAGPDASPNEGIISAFLMYLFRRLIELVEQSRAARVIQKCFRKYLSMKEEIQRNKAAYKIQAAMRIWVKISKLQKARASAKLACFFHTVVVRSEYCRAQRVSVSIQATFRGHLGRLEAVQMRSGEKIKAAFLLKAEADNLAKQTQAAILLSKTLRGTLARIHFEKQKKAQLIGNVVRTRLVCDQFQKAKSSATVLQALVRCLDAQVKLSQGLCAIVIQSCFRTKVQCDDRYQNLDQVIFCQAVARGFIDRLQVKRMKASETLDAIFQTKKERQSFQNIQRDVIFVQSLVRRYQDQLLCRQMRGSEAVSALALAIDVQESYKKKKEAVVVLQAAYRGRNGRIKADQHRSALHLGASVLTLLERTSYHHQKNSAVIVQKHIRGLQCREFCRKSRSAESIQSVFKVVRKREKYLEEKKAVVVMQATFRGMDSRIKYQQVQMSEKLCAMVNMVSVFETFQREREVAIRFQALARGHLGRVEFKKLHSSVVLGACVKTLQAKEKHGERKRLAEMIQKNVRGFLARDYFSRTRATEMIQSLLKTKNTREIFCEEKSAAVTVQKIMRGYHARQECQRLRKSEAIGATVRSLDVFDGHRKTKRAAVVLQAAFRGRCGRIENDQLRSAVKIQSCIRNLFAQHDFIQKKKAAVLIEKIVRGRQAREMAYKIRSAEVLQSLLKMKNSRNAFLEKRDAAVKLQSALRGLQDRLSFHKLKRGETIGALFKLCGILDTYKEQQKSAIVLQSSFRGRCGRIEASQLAASVSLQSAIRCLQEHSIFEQKKGSAIDIQKIARGHQIRVMANKMRSSERIQSLLRMKETQDCYLEEKRACICLQSVFRGRQDRILSRQLKKGETIRAAVRVAQAFESYHQEKGAAVTCRQLSEVDVEELKLINFALQSISKHRFVFSSPSPISRQRRLPLS